MIYDRPPRPVLLVWRGRVYVHWPSPYGLQMAGTRA